MLQCSPRIPVSGCHPRMPSGISVSVEISWLIVSPPTQPLPTTHATNTTNTTPAGGVDRLNLFNATAFFFLASPISRTLFHTTDALHRSFNPSHPIPIQLDTSKALLLLVNLASCIIRWVTCRCTKFMALWMDSRKPYATGQLLTALNTSGSSVIVSAAKQFVYMKTVNLQCDAMSIYLKTVLKWLYCTLITIALVMHLFLELKLVGWTGFSKWCRLYSKLMLKLQVKLL